MQEQELTPSGGLDEVQTRQQIDFGVSSSWGSVTISISERQTWLELCTRKTLDGIEFEIVEHGEKNWDETSYLDSYGWVHKKIQSHLFDWFRRAALVRYVQIWGKVNAADFRRGFRGASHLVHSFSGMIGGFNCDKRMKKINGSWYAEEPSKLYRNIREFPAEGIARAKQLAWEIRNQESAKHQTKR